MYGCIFLLGKRVGVKISSILTFYEVTDWVVNLLTSVDSISLSLQDNTVLPSRYVFVLHSNSGHILRVAPFNHALTSYTLSWLFFETYLLNSAFFLLRVKGQLNISPVLNSGVAWSIKLLSLCHGSLTQAFIMLTEAEGESVGRLQDSQTH